MMLAWYKDHDRETGFPKGMRADCEALNVYLVGCIKTSSTNQNPVFGMTDSEALLRNLDGDPAKKDGSTCFKV